VILREGAEAVDDMVRESLGMDRGIDVRREL
jgi:hypothetical protein